MCVTDLNSDGLDDLLVGAPLHPPSDAGRMYVFLNNAKVSKCYIDAQACNSQNEIT